MMAPQNVFDHCAKNAQEEKAETWWFLILIYGANKKKVIFDSLGYPVLP